MPHDSRVDDYIEKAQPFAQPILRHLRAVAHKTLPDLEEAMKWGMPHFMLRGKNLAGMSAFKAHAAFIIHHDGGTSDAMGQFGKLTQMSDLPDEDNLAARLIAAREKLRTPAKARVARPEIPMPDDLAAVLSTEARGFLDGLAPSHRREYLVWITEAKRPETRAKRIAEAAERLAAGLKRS